MMVFTENDRQTMRMLCTLVRLSKKRGVSRESIIKVGQHLGVPKDDTLMLFEEMEEIDVIRLDSKEEKVSFIKSCFSFMNNDYNPEAHELKLYQVVVNQLGVSVSSN